jgi:hypothetical protein
MNIYVSPTRKGFLITPNESLKTMKVNFTDSFFEASRTTRERKNDSRKQLDFEHDALKSHTSVNLLAKTRMKKKKCKIRPQINCRKADDYVGYPVREGTKVRFQIDDNNNVKHEYADAPLDHFITRDDIATNWWTKQEMFAIKEQINKVCCKIISEQKDYKNALIRLLIRCGAQRTGELLHFDSLFDNTESDEDDDVSTLVDGDTRGLEKRIILSMLLPFHRHKRSIHAA